MKTQQSEHDTMLDVMNYIKSIGGYVVRINTGGLMKGRIKLAPAGTPDLIACIKSIFFAIEIKKDEKEISRWQKRVDLFKKTAVLSPYTAREAMQYKVALKIKEAGGIYLLTCSVEDFQNTINHILGVFKEKNVTMR